MINSLVAHTTPIRREEAGQHARATSAGRCVFGEPFKEATRRSSEIDSFAGFFVFVVLVVRLSRRDLGYRICEANGSPALVTYRTKSQIVIRPCIRGTNQPYQLHSPSRAVFDQQNPIKSSPDLLHVERIHRQYQVQLVSSREPLSSIGSRKLRADRESQVFAFLVGHRGCETSRRGHQVPSAPIQHRLLLLPQSRRYRGCVRSAVRPKVQVRYRNGSIFFSFDL